MKEIILKQFDLYRKDGICLNGIEDLHNLPLDHKQQLGYCRLQIVDNKIYGENVIPNIFPVSAMNKFDVLVTTLNRLSTLHPIKNVDFIFFAVDNLIVDKKISNLIGFFPFFMMSCDTKKPEEKNSILIPDAYIMYNKTWSALINDITEGSKENPWGSKDSSKVFWRGATTGGEYNINNYDNLPRLSLVMMSKSFPHLIDARFTHFGQFSNNPSGRNLFLILDKMFGHQARVTERDHLKYKYLISIDGNTAAWLRVPWILLSNSVLLKQETSMKQFFYPALQPFVHYIPIKEDISDVFDKLHWLQNNDDKAKVISKNATDYVINNLMPNDIDNYLLYILNEYHSLQRFEIKAPTLPLLTTKAS